MNLHHLQYKGDYLDRNYLFSGVVVWYSWIICIWPHLSPVAKAKAGIALWALLTVLLIVAIVLAGWKIRENIYILIYEVGLKVMIFNDLMWHVK